jgi:hypothetical protein
MTTPPLILVSYVSQSRIPARGPAMRALIAQCERNNAASGITGALYFDGARFVQVLEGAAHAVDALFATIRKDRRHADIALLSRTPIGARRFGAWSMKMVDGSAFAHLRNHFDRRSLIGAPPAALERRMRLLERL